MFDMQQEICLKMRAVSRQSAFYDYAIMLSSSCYSAQYTLFSFLLLCLTYFFNQLLVLIHRFTRPQLLQLCPELADQRFTIKISTVLKWRL